MVVAVAAVLVSGVLAAGEVTAQIDARLRAAGAGADTGLLAVESDQLSLLREIEFTSGLGAALAAKDSLALNRLVTPLQVNSGVPMVDVVRPGGVVILAVRSQGAPRPVATRKGVRAIRQAIDEAHGARGGRFTELTTLQRAPVLLTIGPVLLGDRAVGAVMVMSPLADVLGRLSAEVGTTLSAYNGRGDPVATTVRSDPTRLSPPQDSVFRGGPVQVRQTAGDTREMLGRLIVDHNSAAILGVALRDDSSATELAVDGVGLLGLLVAGAIITGLYVAFGLRRRSCDSGGR